MLDVSTCSQLEEQWAFIWGTRASISVETASDDLEWNRHAYVIVALARK